MIENSFIYTGEVIHKRFKPKEHFFKYSVFSLLIDLSEIRLINKNSMATVGVLSNSDNKNIKLGKAGRKRYLGFRPKVRGVVMNPVDHPHGGGEGRTSGGRHPVTPWGVSTKGKKTRSNKKTNTFIIRRRKK